MRGQAQINLGLAAAGDTVQQRHLKPAGVGERRERGEAAALLLGQWSRWIVANVRERSALERIAFDRLVPYDREATTYKATDHIGAHALIVQHRQSGARSSPPEDVEHLTLLRRQSRQLGVCDRRRRDHWCCLERRGSPRSGRQRGSDRVPNPGHVVVRHPFAEVDNRRWKQRFAVHDVRDITRFRVGFDRRVVSNDASDNSPRTDRHTHARADWRQRRDICRERYT